MPSNTSSKVAGNTGAAKDDNFTTVQTGLTEDSRVANLNVLVNDPGAAHLYSLAQSSSGQSSFPVQAQGVSALGARVSINGDGTIKYDATGLSLQHLAAGKSITDTFIYTVQMGNGAISTASVNVQLLGLNDGPVITNSASSALGSVTEDTVRSVSGKLTATDADDGATQAWSVVGSGKGMYGSLALNAATGLWTYSLNNGAGNVQELAAGEVRTESFVVRVTDDQGAFATQTVSVVVHGSNDVATISGCSVGAAVEGWAWAASGKLNVADADRGEAVFQVQADVAGSYGTFSIDADGQWTYALANGAPNVEALALGELASDTFTVVSKDGTATEVVKVLIIGTNDAASISGTSAGAVAEDTTPTVTGTLVVADVDHGQAVFRAQANAAGTYGSFSIGADGQWTYALANGAAHVQTLAAGEQVSDSFTVVSKDGTASQVVKVVITGTNDAAVISGTSAGAVAEDSTLAASGTLSVTDVDHGEAVFQAQSNVAGGYGTFSMGANGQWTYALDNGRANVQALAAGEQATDSFTALSKDGTAQVVKVVVTGTNDAAAISGTSAGAVADDDTLTAGGTLAVADVDSGEAVFQVQSNVAGGYGTFSIGANGQWTYVLDNAAGHVQALAAGEQASDSFTVVSKDGTASQVVKVVITGTNDAAAISGTSAGAVSEDAATSAAGTLSVSDVDHGEAVFQAQSNAAGAYGTFSIGADGQWTYALDNAAGHVQALAAGEQASDSFTVVSKDGTASQVVKVVITGTNDAAAISGTSAGAVAEDTILTASGTLSVTDADAGQAVFQAQSSVAGAYGSFSIGADGQWTYTLDNGAANVQALNSSDHRSESFTVLSLDGTASQSVTIDVGGLDDNRAPVAVDDLVTGSVTQVVTALTFEEGTYSESQNYDYNTGNYNNTVDAGGFHFTNASLVNSNGWGPWVTGYWGVDYGNALYSYGYNNGNSTSSTTVPIAMARSDGGTFSLASANITSLRDYYASAGVLHETVTGYLHGVQVAQQSFDVPDANNGIRTNLLTFSDSGFASVDKVVFSLTNDGTSYYNNYSYQWIDNLGVNATAVAAQTEDRTVDIDVLANDTDPDAGDTLSVASFAATSALGAAVTLNADGTLHYDPTHAANLQAMAAGESVTDTFTYTTHDQAGAVSNTATVSVVLQGANDAASIGGVATGSVSEDGVLQATGQLVVSDVDHGDALVRAQSNVQGSYGSFSIADDGNWTYSLNNGAANVQALAQSQHVTDSFTVMSKDGTATQQVVVDIAGNNDAPVAANDAVAGGRLTFEEGTYTQNYGAYNPSTGAYEYTVTTGDFVFTGSNNNNGSGPYVTGWWGADGSNALYSNGSNGYYYGGISTTAPIAMTRADGGSFSLDTTNITSYSYGYYGYGYGGTETVTGYLHGVQVAQQSFQVPDANYGTHNNVVTFDAAFASVDKVVFSLTNDDGSGYYYYNYAYQWIDNISVPNTVGQSRDVNVVGNDSDVDAGAHLSVVSFGAFSTHGAAISLNTDGTLHYDPTVSAELQALGQGIAVADSFSYQTQDEHGALSDLATVNLTVVGIAHDVI